MLSAKALGNIFPFHVLLDADLTIKSIGKDLPRTLGVPKEDLVGNFVDSVLSFVEPRIEHWSRKRLFSLEQQDIALEPFFPSPAVTVRLVLTGRLVVTSHKNGECLLVLTPDDKSLRELGASPPQFGVTMSAIKTMTASSSCSSTCSSPPNSPSLSSSCNSSSHESNNNCRHQHAQQQQQQQQQNQIATLTAALQKEQALLESLLPKHAADGLRHGKHVDPVLHEHVTMFFSDIAGFTNMCEKIFPWGT